MLFYKRSIFETLLIAFDGMKFYVSKKESATKHMIMLQNELQFFEMFIHLEAINRKVYWKQRAIKKIT